MGGIGEEGGERGTRAMFGKEFVAGSIAGASGVLAGHPLDTIKTRMQTQTSKGYLSSLHCFRDMCRREGMRSFYRGLSWPMLSKSIEQCLVFGLVEQSKKALPLEGDSLLVASGALAGLVGMGILTPVYVVKVQLQLPRNQVVRGFRGPADVAAFNMSKWGLRGLYAGLAPSFLANPICYGVRFITYEKTQDCVSALLSRGAEGSQATGGGVALASQLIGGGIAGMMTWASAYPLDVVMSRMQAQGAQTKFQDQRRGMVWHVRDMYRKEGVRAFFKGMAPCLLRAFPVNAVIFLVYEQTMNQSWV